MSTERSVYKSQWRTRAVRVQQLLHPVMIEETELCFPQLNTSCRRIQRPHFEVMLTYIILSSSSVLTAVLNLLVIISISHFRKLHTPTNLLLLSLAVSDFFVGLFLFFLILLIDGCWFFGDLMCILYQYLAYIITSASIGNMVIISIDRYVAICYPLHYSSKITQKRMKICVCVCWICSLTFHSLILIDNLKQPGRYNSCFGECIIVINYIAGYADMTFSFIVPIAVIIVLYLRVFVVAVSQARAMRSHITATNLKHSVTAKKSELKAARTLGVVVVVFLLCLCPFYCVVLSGQDSSLGASSATFVICLVYFNSCLNPIIYAFFYPWFRKSIQLIVTLQILKPDSCDINMM
ncbi:trace amine-associated receptor 13c-like [Leuresthes tenuis]|uniref:trace amine-associated receptor 13c-like n=1 Tax=Leuresthes tenuis TaxID=355514 RepID=UPI003B50D8B0